MSPSRVRVLENYALMASKSKANIEKALSGFMEMATTDVSVNFVFIISDDYVNGTVSYCIGS